MGQKVTETIIETYITAKWLGIDWLAKDPDNLYSRVVQPMGDPVLLPEGEYIIYKPEAIDEPYLYWHERWEQSELKLVSEKNGWYQPKWYSPVYYWTEYTYSRGYMDVYYNSIRRIIRSV